MQTVAIEGTIRKNVGTKYAKAVRREGQVPCVMYGGENVVHFHAHKNAFSKLIYTPDFKVADLSLEGNAHQAIIKDIQFHPVTNNIVHIDFIELVAGKKIVAEVPVTITGNAPGVKTGGKLQTNIRKVKIEATPEAMVDRVTVDVSSLELGQAVRVRDIIPVEGVTILNPPAIPVAVVEIPRALRSAMNEAKKAEMKAGKK